jgi:enhancer of polycomb-like protein
MSNMRSRQFEYSQPLPVLRHPSEVGEGGLQVRDVQHSHKSLDRENEEVRFLLLRVALTPPSLVVLSVSLEMQRLCAAQVHTVQKGTSAEIPIPQVATSSTYDQDYPQTYKVPAFYVRNATHYDFVEYDLDNEDEDWLAAFNKSFMRTSSGASTTRATANGNAAAAAMHVPDLSSESHEVLSDESFELLINTLELACGAATEAELTRQQKPWNDLPHADKESWAATTSMLSKEHALSSMKECGAFEQEVLEAVYEYWLTKRKRHGKPALRRLCAPPATNDNNPHSVFRPREKVTRVQTRRRRESDSASLERMRVLMNSFTSALDIFQNILKREQLKRDIAHTDVEMQRLRVLLRHNPQILRDDIEKQSAATARKRKAEDAELENGLESVEQVKAAREEGKPLAGSNSRRTRNGQGQQAQSAGGAAAPRYIPYYTEPPQKPEEEMTFTRKLNMSYLSEFTLPQWLDSSRCSARFSRCGRIVIDQSSKPPLGPWQEVAPAPAIPEAPDVRVL